MLTACFDAAGKLQDKRTPVIVVAGFSSFDGVWTDLERQWLAVLDEFGVPHFHAGDFAHSRSGFERLKGNEEARRDLVSRLLNVIERCGLRKFGAVIKKSDLFRAKAALDLSTDSTLDPYVLCCRCALDDVYAFAKSEGIGTQIRTIFEKGDSEDLLRKHLKRHALPDAEFAWSKRVIRKGKAQPLFVGLQAAGWAAWEYYVDFCRVSGLSEHDPTDQGRAALGAFERMPGHIKIPYLSNPLQDLLVQMDGSFRRKVKIVHDATRRLTTIRASRQ